MKLDYDVYLYTIGYHKWVNNDTIQYILRKRSCVFSMEGYVYM